jgi:hypothetical protein
MFLIKILPKFLTKIVDKNYWHRLFLKVFDKSFDKSCSRKLLTKVVVKSCWQKWLTNVVYKNCWWKLLMKVVDKSCWQKLLTKVVDKSGWQKMLTKIVDESCWQKLSTFWQPFWVEHSWILACLYTSYVFSYRQTLSLLMDRNKYNKIQNINYILKIERTVLFDLSQTFKNNTQTILKLLGWEVKWTYLTGT